MIYKTKPWKHQRQALEYLYQRDIGALYTDMGTGKTKVMIDLMRNRKDFRRVLIVGTVKACEVWEEEIKIHGKASKFRVIQLVNLDMDKKINKLEKELEMAKEDADDVTTVIIVNYESVWRKPLDKVLLRKKKTAIDTVICDESHKIKAPASKCSRYLARIGKIVPHRYLVTGTPTSESPMDVYAQYRFLDPSIFGTNYTSFCDLYQNVDVRISSRVGYTVLDKKHPYKNLDDLKEKMFSCAFCVASSVKLPPTKSINVEFELEDRVSKLYKEMKDEGIVELNGGVLDITTILSMVLREQQLTSGYLPVEDEDGEVKIVNVSKARLNAFKELLNTFDKDEPIVVFARYKKDLKNIRKACKQLGISYSELSGDHDNLKEWKDGDTIVLGVQYTSGSESINLTRARICVFYSLHHSYALYKQARKRTHRPGQTRKCKYYTLIAKCKGITTIDEKMVEARRCKQDVVDYIMEGRLND